MDRLAQPVGPGRHAAPGQPNNVLLGVQAHRGGSPARVRRKCGRCATLPFADLLRSEGLRTQEWNNRAELHLTLDAPSLRALRDAISDALLDIEAATAERLREESFWRISEEMHQAEELGGGAGCYYVHPDIHYVAPEQVQAKVAELEAAGVKRYMVLRDPAADEPAASQTPADAIAAAQ